MAKSPIIPEAQVLPKYFTSHRTYVMRDLARVGGVKESGQYDPVWEFDPTESDPTLTQQVQRFVTSTGAVLVSNGVSAPSVQMYQTDNKRLYILACAIMYIPMVENVDDEPRRVDGPASGSADARRKVPGPVDPGDLV
jgi:hypothetical protein